MRPVRVCAHITREGVSCPNLAPCPTHSRPKNAPWSNGRNRQDQERFRRAVLARDGWRCTRCASRTQLVAHHVRPGYDVSDGITLCEDCHREVDHHAR